MKSSFTLTLCIIIKDGGSGLSDTIMSAAHYIDELILVDNSTRHLTFSIANAYNATLLRMPPPFSYPEALQAAVKEASCDWILLLDEGDRIEPSSPTSLSLLHSQPAATSFCCKRITSEPDHSVTAETVSVLFQNSPHLHRQLSFLTQAPLHSDAAENRTQLRPFTIYRSVSLAQLQLQVDQMKQQTSHPDLPYWAAMLQYYKGEYFLAIDALLKALPLMVKDSIYTSHARVRLAQSYLLMQQFEPCLEAVEQALLLDPDYPDLHYVRGAAYLGLEQWDAAAAALLQCAASCSMTHYYISDCDIDPIACYRLAASCYNRNQAVENMMELMDLVLSNCTLSAK
ncbi:glycosyltransferase [Paenibacillus taiwanensis]|uniref:glycosyltransferase n=1 Tax=Paenibacillus taiwanensis TaxID=401638 RepID=UPI000410909A|nr:glycosyltransferase [Paenibacillus taiwanensis]